MRLVYAGNYYSAHEPFEGVFKEVVDAIKQPITLTKDDVVLFGGGEDIWAGLYNQKPNPYNGNQHGKSFRDSFEESLFADAVKTGCGIIGICRGAQLACALSGGSLYQHVVNHGQNHYMTTSDGEDILVSSVHHQMMNPEGTDHQMLGWSESILSRVHLVEDNKNVEVDVEPEVIYFNKTRALAIQYHPEFMPIKSRGVTYAQELVKKFFFKE